MYKYTFKYLHVNIRLLKHIFININKSTLYLNINL